MAILDTLADVLVTNGLITAFAFVGIVVWLSYLVSNTLTAGRIHGSAIAILTGLVLAWMGGVVTGGSKGLADITVLSKDIMTVAEDEILSTQAVYTIVGGKVAYRR